jgi:hypothetical protein
MGCGKWVDGEEWLEYSDRKTRDAQKLEVALKFELWYGASHFDEKREGTSAMGVLCRFVFWSCSSNYIACGEANALENEVITSKRWTLGLNQSRF